MERILDDRLERCDAMYLYANDSVLDFYPRFGFAKAMEYQPTVQAEPRYRPERRLDMSNRSDIALLREAYPASTPFSELTVLDNWGLLMFYCSTFMKHNVFYVGGAGAVAIAGLDQDRLGEYLCG